MKKHIRYKQISSEALETYRTFSAKDGSQHIATPITIQALIDLNKEMPIRYVLEMGAGIGTISYTLLKYTDANVDLYEDNHFCQGELAKNLSGFTERCKLLTDYSQKPTRSSYDLFVVDGGSGKGEDGGRMKIVQFLAAALDDVKVCYIEGGRHTQRTLLRRTLSRRFRYRLVEYDYAEAEGQIFKGGLAIHCQPTRSVIIRWINFIYWEVTEWTPIKNAIVYRLQCLKKRSMFK